MGRAGPPRTAIAKEKPAQVGLMKSVAALERSDNVVTAQPRFRISSSAATELFKPP
jgi:hypothetical protein